MKKRTWILAAVVLAVAGVGGVAVLKAKAASVEDAFQADADAKRKADVHEIAERVEAYRVRAGRPPFADRLESGGGAYTVIIGAPKAEQALMSEGNPLGGDQPAAGAVDLGRELRAVLGGDGSLPVDPQRGATGGAPNAYYLRVKPGGQYLVAAFLRRPDDRAVQVAPGIWAYALRSEAGAWGAPIWNHARTLAQVSPEERGAIIEAGRKAEAKFARYARTRSDPPS
ncbi:MAG: hypothetical protein QM608_04055 [Caulobacter sp.]